MTAMTHAILVVEDEYLVAMEICRWLEEARYEVIGPAASVRQALSLLQGHTPSACVLDINLKGEFSFPVAEELKVLGVPFVVTSAYSLQLQPSGVLHDVTNLGKPTRQDQLLATLEQLLR
jgi:DNA-binding response OmpR family regulator